MISTRKFQDELTLVMCSSDNKTSNSSNTNGRFTVKFDEVVLEGDWEVALFKLRFAGVPAGGDDTSRANMSRQGRYAMVRFL